MPGRTCLRHRGRGRWGCHPIAAGDVPPPKTGDRPTLGQCPRVGPRFRRFRRCPLVADSAHCRRSRGSVCSYSGDVVRRPRLRSDSPPGCPSRRLAVGPRRGDTRPPQCHPQGVALVRLGSVVSTSPTGRKGAPGENADCGREKRRRLRSADFPPSAIKAARSKYGLATFWRGWVLSSYGKGPVRPEAGAGGALANVPRPIKDRKNTTYSRRPDTEHKFGKIVLDNERPFG